MNKNPDGTLWEVVDDEGTIASGTEEEMRILFDQMRSPYEYNLDPWKYKWKGKLKLIQIHGLHN